MEVWDTDATIGNDDDITDKIHLPNILFLISFDLSNPITVLGKYGIGNLTMSYGNLTADPSSCNSVVTPTLSSFPHSQKSELIFNTFI